MPYHTFIDVSKEYEKNKELKKEDAQLLQEWIAGQPHLPEVSELYLILFLHTCYYNIEATKKRIEAFYTVRARMPEFFKNRRASINTKIVDTVLLTPLPRPTPQGYQIFYIRFIDFNPNNFFLEEHIKSFDMAYTLLLHQNGTRPGHIIVTDLTGVTSEHIAKMSSATIKNFFYYFQEALPIRLNEYIFINMPSYMDEFWALIVPYIKKELLEMIKLYGGDLEGLYKTIPKEYFPSDYGGESNSIEELTKQWKENLLAYETFFIEGEKEIADESKRLRPPRSAADIFREEDTVFNNTYGI